MNREFIYEIIDKNVEDTERFIVQGSVDIKEINDLIFYLQYEFHKELDEITLIPFDIENLLVNLYGFTQIDEEIDQEIDLLIDLSDNLEENLNEKAINRILSKQEEYYVEGLIGELREIVIEVVYNNPGVFAEKFKELSFVKDGITYYPVLKRVVEEVNEAK